MMDELMDEHKKLNPIYTGSAVAPLPTFHERDHKMKPWDYWAKEQERAVRRWFGDAMFERLEE